MSIAHPEVPQPGRSALGADAEDGLPEVACVDGTWMMLLPDRIVDLREARLWMVSRVDDSSSRKLNPDPKEVLHDIKPSSY